MAAVQLRKVDAVRDASALARIYNHYIKVSTATFEEELIPDSEMQRRVESLLANNYPYLVAESAEQVVGYAYVGPYNPRSGYRHTAESTIYLNPEWTGRGLGRQLYTAVIEAAKQRQEPPLRVLLAKIALPNPGSIRVHKAMGFVEAGRMKGAGKKFGRFIDTVYMLLELAGEDDPRFQEDL